MKRRPRYFIYRSSPFRPLFHEHHFQEPRVLKAASRKPIHIWWFLDRKLVQRMVREFNAYQPTSYAEERDYVRIAGGATPQFPSTSRPTPRKNESIDDL